MALPGGIPLSEQLKAVEGGWKDSSPWVEIWAVAKSLATDLTGSYIWAKDAWQPLIEFLKKQYDS